MIDSGLFSSHQFGISRTRKVMSMQVKFYDDVEDALLRFAVIISKADAVKSVSAKYKFSFEL